MLVAAHAEAELWVIVVKGGNTIKLLQNGNNLLTGTWP